MGASKYLPYYKSSRGKWVLGLYIPYSNRSSMFINFLSLDKYETKYTGSWTKVLSNIRQTYDQTIMDKRTENILELYVKMA